MVASSGSKIKFYPIVVGGHTKMKKHGYHSSQTSFVFPPIFESKYQITNR